MSVATVTASLAAHTHTHKQSHFVRLEFITFAQDGVNNGFVTTLLTGSCLGQIKLRNVSRLHLSNTCSGRRLTYGPYVSGRSFFFFFFFFFKSCFTSTETARTIRDGEPRTSTSTVTQLLCSGTPLVHCCVTSTEIRTIRDGEPRTATSTFTQLLSSEPVLRR